MEKIYNSEEEFLKDYDSSKFEKLSMTADILIVSVSNEEADNYADERDWNILLYFFSELFGDSLWLKTKSYNNIAIEYDQSELYKPFET